MRIVTLAIVLFLLSAFAVGVSMQDTDITMIDSVLNNATRNSPFANYNKTITDDRYTNGMIFVVYEFCDFALKGSMEVMRLGILFGYENPDYFTPESVLYAVKWFAIIILISLLIQPLFYLGAFLVIFVMWLLERIKNRKDKKELRILGNK